MLICIFVGFSSGLPLYFIMQFVPAWLRRFDVDLKTIGLIGLVQLPYAWKFFWSPLCDRFGIGYLGRRRGWMLITQILLLLSMALLGLANPSMHLNVILIASLLIAFFSATQDIVIDAYRRDLLPDHELGLGNSFYVNAYRVAGLVPGGLGMILSDHLSWPQTFFVIALFMVPGILCTLAVSEPALSEVAPRTLRESIVDPFKEFFSRKGVGPAVLILLFMLLYKFGDTMATALITPFYIDMGFSNSEIGQVAKLVGFWSMIIGGFIGGLIMVKIGINKSLWLFGVVQIVSILGFALLAEIGYNIQMLAFAVGFEYLGVGLGSAAFTAFIAAQSNKRFSATQLALFTSLFALPRSTTGVIAGVLVEGVAEYNFKGVGWTTFFIICFFTAIPGMVLLHWVAPWKIPNKH